MSVGKKFHVGDKVVSLLHGYGKVTCVEKDLIYVKVDFPFSARKEEIFTHDGKFVGDIDSCDQILFHEGMYEIHEADIPLREYDPHENDRVLVRGCGDGKWKINIFFHKTEDGFYSCLSGTWFQCIPYEGNEHLLGTNDNPVYPKFMPGDRVYSPLYGEGYVTKIIDFYTYSVYVRFKDTEEQFTSDGRLHDEQIFPILFHSGTKIIDTSEQKENSEIDPNELIVDEFYYIWMNYCNQYFKFKILWFDEKFIVAQNTSNGIPYVLPYDKCVIKKSCENIYSK